MAKKSRRARSTPRLSAAQLVGTREDALSPAPERARAARRAVNADAARGTLVRQEDYSYVSTDLRRIGIIAGALFLGMAILSVVLPQFIR